MKRQRIKMIRIKIPLKMEIVNLRGLPRRINVSRRITVVSNRSISDNMNRPLLVDRDPEFPYRDQLTNYMEYIEVEYGRRHGTLFPLQMIKRIGVLGLVAEYNAIKM